MSTVSKDLILQSIRSFDRAKHGTLFHSSEFLELSFGSRSENERDKGLELLFEKLKVLESAYVTLWKLFLAEKSDCDEKLINALEKRVVPTYFRGAFKAPQFGIELCEYSKLARHFTLQDEVDVDVWKQLISGFQNLRENLVARGARFTFNKQLFLLQTELAEVS